MGGGSVISEGYLRGTSAAGSEKLNCSKLKAQGETGKQRRGVVLEETRVGWIGLDWSGPILGNLGKGEGGGAEGQGKFERFNWSSPPGLVRERR